MEEWLLHQTPAIVVLGVAIWWLANKLTAKDKELSEISKETIKLTVLWHEKYEKLNNNEYQAAVLGSLKSIHDKINKKP